MASQLARTEVSSHPHCDCAVQTSSSTTNLTLLIDNATKVYPQSSNQGSYRFSTGTSTPCECAQRKDYNPNSNRKGGSEAWSEQSSAARRHFAKYEPRQLREMNDDIELGWDCGICLETAEDPCVTRCGHLYCQSHLNHWLSEHPSCPVCKALCTPAQDVVPIFSRGRISPVGSPTSSERVSSTSSARASPAPPSELFWDRHSATPITESPGSPTPTVQRRPWTPMLGMSDYDINVLNEQRPLIPPSPPLSPCPSHSVVQPPPHPLMTSYVLAHYLGVALRVVGVTILLGVLLR